jgi:hypothetical protein
MEIALPMPLPKEAVVQQQGWAETGHQKLIVRGNVNNPCLRAKTLRGGWRSWPTETDCAWRCQQPNAMPLVCTGPRAPSKQQLTFEWGDAKLHVPVCMHANTFQNNKTIQLRTLQTETVV